MISIECLKGVELSCCKDCPLRRLNYCKEFVAFLPKLAKRLSIDTLTGKANQSLRFNSKDVSYDIFMDTLFAIEKNVKNFQNKSSFATWALQICRNKENDYLKTKYKTMEHFLSNEEDDDNIDDDNIVDMKKSIDEHNDENELKKVLMACFMQLVLVNKTCGLFLTEIYRYAMQLIEDDDKTILYDNSNGINFKEVLLKLSSAKDQSFESMHRKFYRCRKQLDPNLSKCLADHGYNTVF